MFVTFCLPFSLGGSKCLIEVKGPYKPLINYYIILSQGFRTSRLTRILVDKRGDN